MNIVGPGSGQETIFTSGSGTISYCGFVPANPPQTEGLITGGGGTVESSNIFYGNVTNSGMCPYAPSSYSQWFNSENSTPSMTTTTTQTSSGPYCNTGASVSGVEISSPACSSTVSPSSLTVSGTDSLAPGNYILGSPDQAVGFPCNNGGWDEATPNPPSGCPAESQLNTLSAWVGNYNSAENNFQVHMNVSDLSDLTTVGPPAQGQFWSVQWVFHGTEYFAQMFEWLSDATTLSAPSNPATGLFPQVVGISFWYGTITYDPATTDGARWCSCITISETSTAHILQLRQAKSQLQSRFRMSGILQKVRPFLISNLFPHRLRDTTAR